MSMVEQHPNILAQLTSEDPELAASLKTNDLVAVRTLMMKRYMKGHMHTFTKQQEMNAMWNDPDNPENQAKMAEMIRQKNVEENYLAAYEHLPESFGHITMLYVNIAVNGTPVRAFVDSGAQMTIMSASCAERCGIMRLLDKRYVGEARGGGSGACEGRTSPRGTGGANPG